MKKISAILLAAALILSTTACSESSGADPGTDISVVSQKKDPDSSSGKDILTPATTEAQDLVKRDWSEFRYYSKNETFDDKTMIKIYYDGEMMKVFSPIVSEQIFQRLCEILKTGEITLKGEQSVMGGADALLTLTDEAGKDYKISEGLLIAHPGEEGGSSVYIFTGPNTTLYFGAGYKDMIALETIVKDAVSTKENLRKTEKVQLPKKNEDDVVKVFLSTPYYDYRYYSSAEEYDNIKRERTVFKGEIEDDDIKHQLFDLLSSIVSGKDMTLKNGQSVGQAGPELSISNTNGKQSYVFYEGLLTNGSEEAGGTSVFVFATPEKTFYFSARSDNKKLLEDLTHGGVISDKNIVKKEKVESAEKTIDSIRTSKYSDFTFISGQQIITETSTYTRKYYKGEIKTDNYRQELFGLLNRILASEKVETAGKYQVTGGARDMLTLRSGTNDVLSISEGILVPAAKKGEATVEGGPSVFIVKIKQDRLYFNTTNELREQFKGQLQLAVQTKENLIKTEDIPRPEGKKSAYKPKFPISYIDLRTNWAWGEHINGICIDADGKIYSFDFSNSLPRGGDLLESVVNNLKEGIGNILDSGAVCDTTLLKTGVEYASKMSSDAVFTQEHKMCDYGQNTLYAVVSGKAVKLYSKGDNDEFTDDVNAKKAIECFENACRKPVKAVDIPD